MVKDNLTIIKKFPENFRFQLTQEEYEILRSQIATLRLDKGWGTHRKYLPYVFTKQGVSMLSAVLKSETAIEVGIKIIDSFVNMRKFISQNNYLFQRMDLLEEKQKNTNKQGLFFDRYIFTKPTIRKIRIVQQEGNK